MALRFLDRHARNARDVEWTTSAYRLTVESGNVTKGEWLFLPPPFSEPARLC